MGWAISWEAKERNGSLPTVVLWAGLVSFPLIVVVSLVVGGIAGSVDLREIDQGIDRHLELPGLEVKMGPGAKAAASHVPDQITG